MVCTGAGHAAYSQDSTDVGTIGLTLEPLVRQINQRAPKKFYQQKATLTHGVSYLGAGVSDSGSGFRDSGYGIRDSGFGIRVTGFGLRDSGFRLSAPSTEGACCVSRWGVKCSYRAYIAEDGHALPGPPVCAVRSWSKVR